MKTSHPNPHLINSVLGAPVPGQSLTHAPKSMPYEKPPQHNTVEEATHAIMDNITEPHNMKQILAIMDAGMPLEAIARSLVFSGFALGKWTVDTGMLMYKPVLLALIAVAYRAKIHDVPITMPMSMEKYLKQQKQIMGMVTHINTIDKEPEPVATPPAPVSNTGFMARK